MKIKQIKKWCILLAITLVITCIPPNINIASTTTSEEKFRELYLNLLENGDTSMQDISDLNLPYMTCYHIMEDVKRNEGFIAYQSYKDYNLIEIVKIETKESTPYLSQFHLSQDDSGFQQRYATVKQIIADVQKGLDSKMTDLDKVLYFHEYVVEQIYYKDTEAVAEHLGGATLAQGYGVCEGYAKALMLFLKSEQIPCELLAGGSHAWVAVKLDGEWYHVDPTWDDTTSASYGTHYFFIRNDDEFKNTLTKKHAQWVTNGTFVEDTTQVSSTSTNYTSWYVHEVRNRMYYYDGYWYYVLNNTVRKNNIQGTEETIIYEGQSPKITEIKDGVLTIISAGEEKQLTLQKETAVATPSSAATAKPLPSPVTSQPEATTAPPQSQTPATTTVPTTTETPSSPTPSESPKTELEKPIIQSLTNKKGKKMKLVLKKKVTGATGYKILYSTNKNFKKAVKKAIITDQRKTKMIGKLQLHKTYYVKVAAYKKDVTGEIIYSSYSKIKKIKIRK